MELRSITDIQKDIRENKISMEFHRMSYFRYKNKITELEKELYETKEEILNVKKGDILDLTNTSFVCGIYHFYECKIEITNVTPHSISGEVINIEGNLKKIHRGFLNNVGNKKFRVHKKNFYNKLVNKSNLEKILIRVDNLNKLDI